MTTHLEKRRSPEGHDISQGYLWTRETFDGDFALEFDFKPLRENGLALLCLRAAGMQGEDFMADYPLRRDGSMTLVYGENVRLYHWEYFREMDDCRADVASHALIKQPWNRPLAYRCLSERLALGEWHRLNFVQEGGRLRGAVNGRLVFDMTDDPATGHGPVLRTGRLGLRCMTKTDIVYRDLKIWTRSGAARLSAFPRS